MRDGFHSLSLSVCIDDWLSASVRAWALLLGFLTSSHRRWFEEVVFHSIDRWLLRPVSAYIDPRSWREDFQDDVEQVVDHNAKTKELPSPDTTPVVSFEPLDERETVHA